MGAEQQLVFTDVGLVEPRLSEIVAPTRRAVARLTTSARGRTILPPARSISRERSAIDDADRDE
jgi:hypothetical protein